MLAHATVSNTARNSVDRLVWEPCHSYAVPCQGYSTSVGGASFMPHAGIFSPTATFGGFLVASDTRHHGSHHKTALEERLFEINVKRCQPSLAAIWQLIRIPGLVEGGESACW